MISDEEIAARLAEDLARRPSSSLRHCPPLEPLPAQAAIIHAAVTRARSLGLSIPPALRIHTVGGGDDDLPGETDGTVKSGEVWLDVGTRVQPAALEETALHEMMHVHDTVTGRPFDRLDWERRAIAFAARAMAVGVK